MRRSNLITWNPRSATWQWPGTNRRTFIRLANNNSIGGYIDANITGCGQGTLTACSINGAKIGLFEELVPSEVVNNSQFISLFPNPASKTIKISNLDQIGDENYINSSIGQNVVKIHKKQFNDHGEALIDISALNSGHYFLNVNCLTGENKISKFVKN